MFWCVIVFFSLCFSSFTGSFSESFTGSAFSVGSLLTTGSSTSVFTTSITTGASSGFTASLSALRCFSIFFFSTGTTVSPRTKANTTPIAKAMSVASHHVSFELSPGIPFSIMKRDRTKSVKPISTG